MSIQVQTAYNVVIDYNTANSWKRSLAYITDFFIIASWFFIFTVFVFSISFQSFSFKGEYMSMLYILVVLFPVSFYHLLFEYFNNGQSPGKMLMNIRVIHTNGTHPGLSAYLIRWLFRPFDFLLTYGMLAFIMIGFTKNAQRLGDYVADTTVINLKVAGTDKNISSEDLSFRKQYKVTYPNLLTLLSDKDIQVIISVMHNNSADKTLLANKLEEVTGYPYDKKRINGVTEYLNTILNDYNYLASQGLGA